jgi:hypothetical protein
MRISEVQLRKFIEKYLHKLSQLTPEFSQENKLKIFPYFLIKPYETVGIISTTHGLAIEFFEEASTQSIRIFELGNRIENAVLPQKSTNKVAFRVGTSRNCAIGKMGIYTSEFLEKYVEKAEGTILKLQPPLDGFIQVSNGGDVILYDIQLGAILNDKPSIKTIKGALWIFGSNSLEDFTPELAEKRAIEDFNWYLTLATLGMPKFPESAEKTQKLEALRRKIEQFQTLISEPALKERDVQSFFEKNPEFLSFGTTYRRLFPQLFLEKNGKSLRPDFFLERVTDGYCDILDLKLPGKRILSGTVERRTFAADVNEAIAQVHTYKEYFDDPKKREEVRTKYGLLVYKPNIMVLIGASKNIETEDLIKITERYRFCRIITYDDILKQIIYLKEFLEKF